MAILRIREVKSYHLPFSDLPRPVYWFNDFFTSGTWSDRHVHKKWGELVYMDGGTVVVYTDSGSYVVPPQTAAWIPPGIEHEWYLSAPAKDRSLYIAPERVPCLPHFKEICLISFSPLVRELINTLVEIPHLYQPGPDARLIDSLLDQLANLPLAKPSLILPKDRQLLDICTKIIKSPDISLTMHEWAAEYGMSERTFARRFKQQTNMTFGKWRHQARLMYAVDQLLAGKSVTSVSLSCGYSSLSAFIEAFKKVHGSSPSCLSEQRLQE
jgi:AraC-like DNA-binding protein